MDTACDAGGSSHLCDFLESCREDILRHWEAGLRHKKPAGPLSGLALRDHVPDLLERISHIVRAVHGDDQAAGLGSLPRLHALQRLDVGFDLRAVCEELAELRSTVLKLFRSHARGRDGEMVAMEIERLDAALDEVVTTSAATYAAARERTLVALERVSASALGSGALEEFLPRLLSVLLDTTEAADFVSLFLMEGDRFIQRAYVGRRHDAWSREDLGLGEGLAGAVAKTRQPKLIANAAEEPALSPELRRSGMRAVYAVPLIHDGEVVGVAKMGSRTAYDFAAEDLQLFRAMAQRATSLIVQHQLVEEIKRQRALLDALVQQLPVGVAVAEAPSGKLVRLNDEFHRLWGRKTSAESIADYGSFSGFHADGRRLSADEWPIARALLSGEPVPGEEIEIERADGTRITTLQSAAPVRTSDGMLVGAVVTLLDITDRKKVERGLRQQMELRERVMGILGHDLRNPLSAIAISAELLLKDEKRPARDLKVAGRILSSARRASEILAQLTDYARTRLGEGVVVNLAPLHLGELVARIADEVEAANPGATIQREVAGPDDGRWDEGRLGQVVTNLLVNAVRHGAGDRPIVVAVRGAPDAVTLTVHNDGNPIAPEMLPQLFEPFRKAGGAAQGLGLGLFIAREIVRAHGGSIEVRSDAATGTTFTVTLPRGA